MLTKFRNDIEKLLLEAQDHDVIMRGDRIGGYHFIGKRAYIYKSKLEKLYDEHSNCFDCISINLGNIVESIFGAQQDTLKEANHANN